MEVLETVEILELKIPDSLGMGDDGIQTSSFPTDGVIQQNVCQTLKLWKQSKKTIRYRFQSLLEILGIDPQGYRRI